MVDRIREILHARQLSPTQFADAIGVARPIVSHILSGRNKPSLEVVQKISEAFPDLSLSWLMKGIGAMQATKAVDTPSPAAPTSPSTRRAMAAKASETPHVAHSRPETVRSTAATDIASSEDVFEAQQSIATGTSRVPDMPSSNSILSPGPSEANSSFTSTDNSASAGPIPAAPLPTASSYSSISAGSSRAIGAPIATKVPDTSTIQPGTVVPPQAQAFVEKDKSIRRIVIFYQDGTFTDYQPETK